MEESGQLATGGGNILTGVYTILSSIDYINKSKAEAFLMSSAIVLVPILDIVLVLAIVPILAIV